MICNRLPGSLHPAWPGIIKKVLTLNLEREHEAQTGSWLACFINLSPLPCFFRPVWLRWRYGVLGALTIYGFYFTPIPPPHLWGRHLTTPLSFSLFILSQSFSFLLDTVVCTVINDRVVCILIYLHSTLNYCPELSFASIIDPFIYSNCTAHLWQNSIVGSYQRLVLLALIFIVSGYY